MRFIVVILLLVNGVLCFFHFRCFSSKKIDVSWRRARCKNQRTNSIDSVDAVDTLNRSNEFKSTCIPKNVLLASHIISIKVNFTYTYILALQQNELLLNWKRSNVWNVCKKKKLALIRFNVIKLLAFTAKWNHWSGKRWFLVSSMIYFTCEKHFFSIFCECSCMPRKLKWILFS